MSGPIRYPWASLAAASLATVAIAAPANAAITTFSAIADARVGFDEDPFLSGNSNASTAFISGRISPQLQMRMEDSVATLSADYNHVEYLRRYGGNDNFQARADYQKTFSPRFSMNANAGFATQINSTNNFTNFNVLPDLPDVAAVLGRQRQNRIDGEVSATYAPDARSTWMASGDASRSTYSGVSNLADYTQYGGSFGYNRAFSEKFSGGVRVSASFVNSALYDDSRSIQPALQGTWRIDSRYKLSGALGASFVRSGFAGQESNSTNLYVDLTGCREDTRLTSCLNLSRSTQPSGDGGIRLATSGRLNFDYRLSERTRLSAGATYGRFSGDRIRNIGGTRYFYGSVGINRQLTQRLEVGADAGYRTFKGDLVRVTGLTFPSRDASSISASAYLRVKLGSLR